MSKDKDYPKWSEVKALLDDKTVSDSRKAWLLKEYADTYGGPGNPDWQDHLKEIKKYGKDLAPSGKSYDLNDSINDTNHVHFEDGKLKTKPDPDDHQKELFKRAKGRATGQQSQAANDKKLKEAESKLGPGGAGVNTSNELLVPAAHGLEFFKQFGPKYQDWHGSYDFKTQFETPYLQFYDINFGKLRQDAETLGQVHSALSDIENDLHADTDRLDSFWHGPAADAARGYATKYHADANKAIDNPQNAQSAITHTVGEVETSVDTLAKATIGLWTDNIQGITAYQVGQLIDVANKTAHKDVMKHMVVTGWPMFVGYSKDLFADYPFKPKGLDDFIKNQMSKDATTWLNGTFKVQYEGKKKTFDTAVSTAKTAVDKQWASLTGAQGLGKLVANPFSDLAGGITPPKKTKDTNGHRGHNPQQPPDTSGGGGGGGGGTSSAGTGGGGTGGGGTGGGGTGGGGSTSPSGTNQPPSTPPPPELVRPPVQTQPQQPPIEMKPPIETLPPTGSNPTNPGGGGKQVTVKDGKNTYTLSPPDQNGHVKLTVDDGTGHPKSFDLNFGGAAAGTDPASSQNPSGVLDPSQSGSAAPSSPAFPAGPGGSSNPALPTDPSGQSGSSNPVLPTGSSSGSGLLPTDSSPGQSGPVNPSTPSGTPSTGQPGPDSGMQHVTASHGSATVHDGPITVTVDQSSGQGTQLVIDDGSGHTKTYQVDFGGDQPQHATGHPGHDAGGTHHADTHHHAQHTAQHGHHGGHDAHHGAHSAHGGGHGGTHDAAATGAGRPQDGAFTGTADTSGSSHGTTPAATAPAAAHTGAGGAGGGAPMMPMGGMHGGGHGEGGQERGPSRWRTTGDLGLDLPEPEHLPHGGTR